MTRRRLIELDALLLALLALHGLDHELRQPVATPAIVSAIGTLEFALVLFALWLALRRHPSAQRATSVAGFAIAAAYALVHLPPDWGPLSQPYAEIGVDVLSWADLALTVLAGLAIGMAARPHRPPQQMLKRRETAWPSTEK